MSGAGTAKAFQLPATAEQAAEAAAPAPPRKLVAALGAAGRTAGAGTAISGPREPAAPAEPAEPAAPAAPTAIVAALPAELAGVLRACTNVRRGWRAPSGGASAAINGRGQAGHGASSAQRGGADLPAASRASNGRRAAVARGSERWLRGTLGGEDVVLAATGDGAAAAAAGAEALLSTVKPRRLLVLGVAGGLTPGLRGGTLVTASRVVDENGAAAPTPPDEGLLRQALAAGALAGVAVTGPHILGTREAKLSLRAQALGPLAAASPATAGAAAVTGGPAVTATATATATAMATMITSATEIAAAESTTLATLDLESLAYARCAASHGVPYLVVRAVLDPVEETLPLDFEACRGTDGRVSSWKVIRRALRSPRSCGALWRLRGRVAAEAEGLAVLATRLVATPPTENFGGR